MGRDRSQVTCYAPGGRFKGWWWVPSTCHSAITGWVGPYLSPVGILFPVSIAQVRGGQCASCSRGGRSDSPNPFPLGNRGTFGSQGSLTNHSHQLFFFTFSLMNITHAKRDYRTVTYLHFDEELQLITNAKRDYLFFCEKQNEIIKR